MRAHAKSVVAVAVTLAVLIVLYANSGPYPASAVRSRRGDGTGDATATASAGNVVVSVWVSVTKIDRGHLLSKFRKFFGSLVGRRGRCRAAFQLNVIADNVSRAAVDSVVDEFAAVHERDAMLTLVHYDLHDVLKTVAGKIEPFKRFFRSSKGSYYSNDVFYLSPALHLVAPESLDKAIVMDVDTEFRSSVCGLYDAFDNFTGAQLFGMAPELSPVYHHALWKWRNYKRDEYENRKHVNLNGLNSGVVMSYLERIRENAEYDRLISAQWISGVVQKYMFKGHLGDQDWYTLVSYERPELIYRLSCGWNRQLCTWWKQHGYADTFDSFATCTEKVHLYHGNCDTPISPE